MSKMLNSTGNIVKKNKTHSNNTTIGGLKMKIKRKPRLVPGCMICLMLIITASTLNAQGSKISMVPFGGLTFGQQKIGEVVEESQINNGLGLHGGVNIQYSRFYISVTYLQTSHTYSIQDEKVTMKFSDILFGAGIDLVNRKPVTPYIQVLFARPNLQDKESDGFKRGKTFGFGAGIKFNVFDRVLIGLSGIYGLNKYGNFEVKEVPSVNSYDVKGNHFLLLANIGFKINLQ